MAKVRAVLDQGPEAGVSVANGLLGIMSAVRSHAWEGATAERLTPTQGEILLMLRRNDGPMRVNAVAIQLGMSCATVSEAVSTLVAKGHVVKRRDSVDGRALALCLTRSGTWAAKRAARWSEFLSTACDELSPSELDQLQRTLGKVIQVMRARGDMPVAEASV